MEPRLHNGSRNIVVCMYVYTCTFSLTWCAVGTSSSSSSRRRTWVDICSGQCRPVLSPTSELRSVAFLKQIFIDQWLCLT